MLKLIKTICLVLVVLIAGCSNNSTQHHNTENYIPSYGTLVILPKYVMVCPTMGVYNEYSSKSVPAYMSHDKIGERHSYDFAVLNGCRSYQQEKIVKVINMRGSVWDGTLDFRFREHNGQAYWVGQGYLKHDNQEGGTGGKE
jgi:hypothetical protein